jgi:hypothetical protein
LKTKGTCAIWKCCLVATLIIQIAKLSLAKIKLLRFLLTVSKD